MGQQRKTLCVDIDNTLANYTAAFREWMRNIGMYRYMELPDPDVYDFERATGWPFAGRGDFLNMHAAAVKDGLYLTERPYPHAVEALTAMQDEWRIVVATSRFDDCNGDTARWLHRYRVPYDSLLFGHKHDVKADLWLEDNPNTIRALTEMGYRVLHPDLEYCRHSPGGTFHWETLEDDLRNAARR